MKRHDIDPLHMLFHGSEKNDIKGLEQIVWDRLDSSSEASGLCISLLLKVLYYAVKDKDYEFVYTTGKKLCVALGFDWPILARLFQLYWAGDKYHG